MPTNIAKSISHAWRLSPAAKRCGDTREIVMAQNIDTSHRADGGGFHYFAQHATLSAVLIFFTYLIISTLLGLAAQTCKKKRRKKGK